MKIWDNRGQKVVRLFFINFETSPLPPSINVVGDCFARAADNEMQHWIWGEGGKVHGNKKWIFVSLFLSAIVWKFTALSHIYVQFASSFFYDLNASFNSTDKGICLVSIRLWKIHLPFRKQKYICKYIVHKSRKCLNFMFLPGTLLKWQMSKTKTQRHEALSDNLYTLPYFPHVTIHVTITRHHWYPYETLIVQHVTTRHHHFFKKDIYNFF